MPVLYTSGQASGACGVCMSVYRGSLNTSHIGVGEVYKAVLRRNSAKAVTTLQSLVRGVAPQRQTDMVWAISKRLASAG